MDSHKLAIARATFAASLLRPDPATTPLSRQDASQFNSLLDAAIVQCSPSNVQACREWLCHNITPSNSRTIAFGKLLVVAAERDEKTFSCELGACSIRRLRLHLLYVMNDVLHWNKFHNNRTSTESISTALLPSIRRVLCVSAARDHFLKQHHKLSELLEIWLKYRYFTAEEYQELKSSFRQACEKGEAALTDTKQDVQAERSKDAPWIMPATHGDPLTPYYDLPAANMMPLIHPNSTDPIETHRMKALHLTKGPADIDLIAAVQNFLEDVEQMYSPQDKVGAALDTDAMGQEIVLDEMGDRVGGSTYYGWSRAFCEKIQRRAMGGADRERGRSRSRSGSWDGSDQSRGSLSRTARKRRRPFSQSQSKSRSRTRRRSRYSSSRSRSRSNARKYSPSPKRRENDIQPPRAFNISHAPVPPPPPPTFGFQPPLPPASGPSAFHGNVLVPPPPMGMSLIHNGVPIPPPRPPAWSGPWPPPPPPLPSSTGLQFPPGLANSLPPPPPPGMAGSWNGGGGRGNRSQDPRRR